MQLPQILCVWQVAASVHNVQLRRKEMKYPPSLFIRCLLFVYRIHPFFFSNPKSPENPRPEVRWRGGAKGGKGKTIKLMTIAERVFHFQTYCILVQRESETISDSRYNALPWKFPSPGHTSLTVVWVQMLCRNDAILRNRNNT